MTDPIKQALEEQHRSDLTPFLEGLPPAYAEHYRPEEIVAHGEAIAALSDLHPVAVVAQDLMEFTVCTRDAPGLFSYLTGILGAWGFNVQAGRVFTASTGIAIDSFRGTAGNEQLPDDWTATLEQELATLLAPLQRRPPEVLPVREAVMERVLRSHRLSPRTTDPLLPVSIDVVPPEDGTGGTTEVRVLSQDTPFFLYSLATALALQDVSIRSLEIETSDEAVHDRLWVQKSSGAPLRSREDIERLRLSILVTKQFTHALDQAADPRGAFTRFEELVQRVALGGGGERLRSLLADPQAQRELARLLGASDFLWEDFIRLQYENLLPMLGDQETRRALSTPSETLGDHLDRELSNAADWNSRVAVLNRFKDRESYLIDADHILRRNTDFFFLSHRLTRLAEVVVDRAFRLAWEELTTRHGAPESAAGLPASYAVFGLGKMGGSALGYASDIELMTVYSDHGETSPPPEGQGLNNREFFERLVRRATEAIQTKREAIFEIDLRLRPYGKDGPRAVHIESFIEYFGRSGKAHSAERLALIRLRPVAGDSELSRRIVAIRDQIVYESDSIDVSEIRSLRDRQASEKVSGNKLNAKFSPGALVDLEYNVQLLQVEQGRQHPEVRDPGIHATLRTLSELGTIDTQEAEAMIRAYRFLRNLINGLRMLRGNAQDLFLPAFDSSEALHLARRMGYRDSDDLAAAQQLKLDFEVETAAVRSFVERHLGQDALPTSTAGNPADLVLSDSLSQDRIAAVLGTAGFRNPARGIVNLRRMAGPQENREAFARLVVLAWDYLRRSGDADMALNNWDRFTEQVTDRGAFFRELLEQPRRLEVMISIFAGSQFLSDTLIRTPAFLEWISDPEVITAVRSEADFRAELDTTLSTLPDRTERLNALRRFRRREMLRIGTRDICLAGEFDAVVGEISALARAIVDASVSFHQAGSEETAATGRWCVLAFGKLGGRELNYSSDIDLLAIYEPNSGVKEQEQRVARMFRHVVRDLTDFTVEGQAYRVDLRLRPWGNAGRLVYSIPTLERYYAAEAALWELQALIKLSPVAGDLDLGWRFLEALRPVFSRRVEQAGISAIRGTVRQLRARAVEEHDAMPAETGTVVGTDIKNGEGGIRDVEFLVQALQLQHHRLAPEILTGNTLSALRRMEEAGILAAEQVETLSQDYLFLRRIEHFLQVYDDQQLHAIPAEPAAQAKLTRVVLGDGATVDALLQHIGETLARVRSHYLSVISDPS